ncbi:MAG: N-acetylglucosaminyltransferase, partial [Atopobiaceae bacterium]|nr:N-acetylglucosaminyltransferase [Atopobiaceae bacterium]
MIKAGLTPIVIFNFIMLLFFTLAYFYQFVYILHVWRRGDVKIPPAKKQHCYAFVIAAH